MMRLWHLLVIPWLFGACGAQDASPSVEEECALQIGLGTGTHDDFTELDDGEPVEIVLGFQGFRMLVLALQVDGSPQHEVDVLTHLQVDSGEEIDQRDGRVPLAPAPGADESDPSGVWEDYLVFLNDIPTATVIGAHATLEVIVRAGSCTGATTLDVVLRDDDSCIDFDRVLDVTVSDAGVPDDAVACE